MNKKQLELLAPAGSFEALKAAVQNGADAVYLGGGKFNARINANNFTEHELVRAIDYAHERGIKIYITLNTLIKNEEFNEALKFAAFIYEQGADAVIVQDTGLIRGLRKHIPELTLHASTQMTATNSYSVSQLAQMGIKRVVLARELSLKEIEYISKNNDVELETFVHGAICVCYSGQCLMSSFIGGRSGNRGLCAQPCRLPYSVSNKTGEFSNPSYLLSTRDLSAIELLPELMDAGVTSFKLEGRMKSPEYVAVVTQVYRKYIDLLHTSGKEGYKVDETDQEKLLQAFNRGGFTNSYLKGELKSNRLIYTKHPKNQGVRIGKVLDVKPPYIKLQLEKDLNMGDGIEIMNEDRDTVSIIISAIKDKSGHVRHAKSYTSPWVGDIKVPVKKGSIVYRTLSRTLFDDARKTFENKENPIVPLDMSFTLKVGKKAVLTAQDDEGNKVSRESDMVAEKALKRPLDEIRIKEQLNKMGDTPYFLDKLTVDTDGESVIPISALNALRRSVLNEMKDIRISGAKRQIGVKTFQKLTPNLSDKSFGRELELTAFFYELPEDFKGFKGIISRLYLPADSSKECLERARNEFQGEIFLWTFPVLKDMELSRFMEQANKVSDLWDGITYGIYGTLKAIREFFPDKKICADYSMNLFNNEALILQKEFGADTAVLSPELRLSEVEQFLCSGIKSEAIVYGRIPVMTMENCPSSCQTGCSGLCKKCERNTGSLKDRKGEVFPYVRYTDIERTVIFNSYPIFMDDMEGLEKTDLSLLRLIFTREDIADSKEIASCFYDMLKAEGKTNAQIVKKITDKGYTKGHWFRGV